MFGRIPKPFIWISLAFLALQYGAFAYFGYVSAPGGDVFNHYSLMRDLQVHGLSVFFAGYPRLFHLILLIVTQTTGLPPVTAMLYLIPVVQLGCALAASWLAYLLAGKRAALFALIVSLFVVTQPLQTLYDGGFPSVISAHIWLPLMIGSMYCYLRTRSWRWLAASMLWFLAAMATHTFTVLYAALIILSLLIYWPRFLRPYLIATVAAALVFWLSPFSAPLKAITDAVFYTDSSFPWLHVVGRLNNANAIWGLGDYGPAISYLAVYLGVAGLYFLYCIVSRKEKQAPLAYMLVIWIAILFIGSRMTFLGFPVRLARDLSTPLLISAAVCFAWAMDATKRLPWVQIAIVLGCAWIAAAHVRIRFDRITSYEPAMQYSAATRAAQDVVGDQLTAAVDQHLPSIFNPNNLWVHLDAKDPSAPLNQEALWDKEYVYYDVTADHNGNDYKPAIVSHGFREIARFTDPVRTVVLFRRQ